MVSSYSSFSPAGKRSSKHRRLWDFVWRHIQIAIKFSRQLLLLLASSAKCRESLSRDLKIEKFANRWLKESKDKTTRWEKGRKMDAPKVYPQRVLAKIQKNWFGLINLSIALPFLLINLFFGYRGWLMLISETVNLCRRICAYIYILGFPYIFTVFTSGP